MIYFYQSLYLHIFIETGREIQNNKQRNSKRQAKKSSWLTDCCTAGVAQVPRDGEHGKPQHAFVQGEVRILRVNFWSFLLNSTI